MRIQRDVTKYQADLAAKIKARDENQSKIDAKVEAKDKAREVKETEKEDDYDGLFGDDEEEEEEDGQGEVSFSDMIGIFAPTNAMMLVTKDWRRRG